MNKFFLSLLLSLNLLFPLEAQWCFWGQKYCWGCRHYMDPTIATYDGISYGYVDNINYSDTYHLPLNYHFNYCRPCRYNGYNNRYLQKCIRYTNNQ